MANHDFITLPKRSKDLTGLIFGRLKVLGLTGRNSYKRLVWLCRCDCGNHVVISANGLISGGTKSCGCYRTERISETSTIHGMSYNPLFFVWKAMIYRCYNSSNKYYESYGGRGISVCREWKESPIKFIDYVSSLPNCGVKGYSLDRVDNDGDYEPENVKWSTHIEQNGNRRVCLSISYLGKIQCLAAWARDFNMSKNTLNSRIKKGWSIERALCEPVKSRK